MLWRKIKDSGSSKNKLFRSYIIKSKKRGIFFDLTKDYFLSITSKDCNYCGSKPSQEVRCKKNSIPYIYNGIDRQNSDIGYIVGNCVPCCKKCNYAKQSMNVDSFVDWIKKVYNHFVASIGD